MSGTYFLHANNMLPDDVTLKSKLEVLTDYSRLIIIKTVVSLFWGVLFYLLILLELYHHDPLILRGVKVISFFFFSFNIIFCFI